MYYFNFSFLGNMWLILSSVLKRLKMFEVVGEISYVCLLKKFIEDDKIFVREMWKEVVKLEV